MRTHEESLPKTKNIYDKATGSQLQVILPSSIELYFIEDKK